MLPEHVPQRHRQVILERLQFAIGFDALRVRLGGFARIQLDELIGDFGLGLGGAAGDELDRFDLQLGSPAHALVLATSAGRHTDYYQVTVEDVPIMVPGQGGTESPKVRADMVFFETPEGGAVFSVGSVNWLSSLAWNRFDNNVARVNENVLRRFLDPRPFELPREVR